MPRHSAPADPASLVLYEDPLSPWCLVAERRIVRAVEELGAAFSHLNIEPFPIRPEAHAPSRRERRELARAARRAAKEPEAAHTHPDLWLSQDPPLSTLPPLTALAAARLQGAAREQRLREALREAALVRGINVTRADVLYELAEAAGLDVARFAAALSAPATSRRVLEAYEDAIDKGIERVPALVVGDEWLVVGPRTVAEYRSVLRRYASARLGVAPARTVH